MAMENEASQEPDERPLYKIGWQLYWLTPDGLVYIGPWSDYNDSTATDADV